MRVWWAVALAPLSVVSTCLVAWLSLGDDRLGVLLLGALQWPFYSHPVASSPPVSTCLPDLQSPQ